MHTKEGIIGRINELIEDFGWSQSAFSHKIDVDPSNLRKKLNGIQTITYNDIQKIIQSLNVSKEWLEKGEGEKYNKLPDENFENRLKEEIVKLTRQLSKNKELIIKAERENEDIMIQLSTLYSQLDKYWPDWYFTKQYQSR